MKILLTGCAGFIGSHALDRLLADGHCVVGVDNLDPFYSRSLKYANIEAHTGHANFEFLELDLADATTYSKIKLHLKCDSFDAIIHLAAKVGVRSSIDNPLDYQRANVLATQYLLEFAKEQSVKQFVFASSSSVYGTNPRVPWEESDEVLQPISPYASTKISCELLGHVYSHLYGIRFLGLRFFTVYGPRQRPDLAINKFAELIENGQPIPVFGDGSTCRDYTFVEDIIEGVVNALHYDKTNYEIINLGNNKSIVLSEVIAAIETVVGKSAIFDWQPEQPGDVSQTWAKVTKAERLLNYNSRTGFDEGLAQFYAWRKSQRVLPSSG